MSAEAHAPLLQQIEPDEQQPVERGISGNIGSENSRSTGQPVVLTPTNRAALASTPGDAEAGQSEQTNGLWNRIETYSNYRHCWYPKTSKFLLAAQACGV